MKRIITLVLVAAMILSLPGCHIVVEPSDWMIEMWAQVTDFFDTDRNELPADPTEPTDNVETETQPPQQPLPDDNPHGLLAYTTYGLTGIFDDYDWEYMTRDQNWFYKGTGYISHWLTDAKGKYKDAFRSYIKTFVVENELRNSTEDVAFEEEKKAMLEFLQATINALENVEKTVAADAETAAKIVDIIFEYKGMLKKLEELSSFTTDFDKLFEHVMTETVLLGNGNSFKLSVEVTPIDELTGTFKTVGKVAEVITLGYDVRDCIRTRRDVVNVQKRASEFFELNEIFDTIIDNTTDEYMKEAAIEVFDELQQNGYITDIDELIERKAMHTVIDINPIVSVAGGIIDTALVTITPIRDLDSAYAADAIRHIKMACCELLRENTAYSVGHTYYYEAENEEKVNVYLQHCLLSQLFWTYTINKGKKCDPIVPQYAELAGIQLPRAAAQYMKK